MTRTEFLDTLRRLPPQEQMDLLQDAMRRLREELAHGSSPSSAERASRLVAAAEALLPDYQSDSELTAFTSLDPEEFHAQG